MNEKMRILLADDDTEFCARMSVVLDSADDFELVGIAENGEKALSAVNELRPDVLIIELMLPVMDGMSVLSRLHEQDGPHPAVMVFSALQARRSARNVRRSAWICSCASRWSRRRSASGFACGGPVSCARSRPRKAWRLSSA